MNNILSQFNASNNPLAFAMNLLPKDKQNILSSISSANTDEQRAQILANLCNQNGITKAQLQEALRNTK